MPVDPGNLLLTAELDGKPVLGLPGCAKSPKYNGFDMVLERLAAGLPVGRAEIVKMGAGGLLAEIPTRPQPRDDSDDEASSQQAPRVAVLVLAAGRSTRMGGPNKLLQEADGLPLVVHAVKAALTSQAVEVVVVLGHMADQGEACGRTGDRRGQAPAFCHQSRFRRRSQHLGAHRHHRAGQGDRRRDRAARRHAGRQRGAARPADGSLQPVEGRSICVPTAGGKRGNPVLWDRRFFAEMAKVSGDTGAKHLIGEHADLVCEVEMTGEAAITDIDTPEALAAWRARKS
jgi:molybdenum cofactor cytidylyltransferase